MRSRTTIWLLLSCLFFFLLLPKAASAAITISSISPTTITSTGDIITVFATASGLSSTTQYLQVGFTKVGAPANYLGYTKNLSNNWFQYKSSPTTTDFSSYFYSLTPVSGNWSGQIQAKVDTSDSGYAGPGDYTIKLMKYITSSSPTYSNEFVVNINIASAQPNTQTTSQTQTQQSEGQNPTTSWSSAGSTKLGDVFQSTFTISGFSPNIGYFFKIRGGLDQSELNKVQTQSGSSFLSDTDSWSQFPSITTDNLGGASGTVFARIATDKPTGAYQLRLRFRSPESETNIDSDFRSISVGPADPSGATPILTAGNQPASLAAKSSRSASSLLANTKPSSIGSEINFVLGTQSGQKTTGAGNSDRAAQVKSPQRTIVSPLTLVPIIGGLLLIIFGGAILFWPKISRTLGKRKEAI